MFELTGLSVLVTGGTKGIGFGIARVLGKAGCRVVVSGRDAAGAEHAVQRLRDEGCDVSYVLGDVSKEEVCREMVRTTVERHGGLDVLCCNAGIFPSKKLEEMTSEDVDTVMGINLKGTMLLVAAAIPYLEKSGRGRVILTSSITGPITGYPGWSHYAASKSAQLGFMRTAAIELAPKRITVNSILPGNIATEGLEGNGPEYIAAMTAAIPFGSLGKPEDIGYAAAWFASKEAGWVTGQALVVDGGQVLPESLEAVKAARE